MKSFKKLSLLLKASGPTSSLFVVVAGLLIGGLCHWLIVRSFSKARRTVTLHADPGGLQVDGKHYARTDIRALWVTEPTQHSSTTVIVENGWNAGSARAGQAMGQAIGAKFQERGYGVAIRYGGHEIRIVGGIHEGVATELARRLATALQLGS